MAVTQTVRSDQLNFTPSLPYSNSENFMDGTAGVDNSTFITSNDLPLSTVTNANFQLVNLTGLSPNAEILSITLKTRAYYLGTAVDPFNTITYDVRNNNGEVITLTPDVALSTSSQIITATWTGSRTFNFTQGPSARMFLNRNGNTGTAQVKIAYVDLIVTYNDPTYDDFDITQDFSVRVYSSMPAPWGTGSLGWNELRTAVTQVETDAGINTASPLSMRMDVGRMTVTLGHNFDPINIGGLTPNTWIVASVIARPDSQPNIETCLFFGYIKTVDVTYDADGNPVTIIEAFDVLERLNNIMVDGYYHLTVKKSSERLADLINQNAPITNLTLMPATPSDYLASFPAGTDTEQRLLGDYLDELQVTEGSYLVSYPDVNGPNIGLQTTLYWNSTTATNRLNALTAAATDQGFSTVHSDSDTHYCIQDCSFHRNRPTVNKVVVSLSYDPTQTYTVQDSTSISTYGQYAENVAVNMDNLTTAQTLANAYKLDGTHYPWMVDTVTHNALRPDGKLSLAVRLRWNWDWVRVYMNNGTVLNQAYIIGRVRHTIDANSWISDFTLIRPPFKMGA